MIPNLHRIPITLTARQLGIPLTPSSAWAEGMNLPETPFSRELDVSANGHLSEYPALSSQGIGIIPLSIALSLGFGQGRLPN